jgi:nitrate/nitrite transport system substrate-binding protein
MIAALLDAARWLDASRTNREAAAEVLASPGYVNANQDLLQYCLAGRWCENDTKSAPWRGHNGLRFFADGEATFPWLSDGMWFLTQQRRWGLLRSDPSYRAIAQEVNRIDLYRDAAALAGVDLPGGVLRSSTLLDGRVWDGSDPAAYLASFGRTA